MDHQHRPRMLKDFLNEKKISNSCSSNDSGFESLPRKPGTTSMRTLIETDLNSSSTNSNPGIWSKSAFQTVLNAVKAVSFFTAVKRAPLAVINGGSENKSTVKMKDVVKWKLCRDPVAIAAEEPPSPAAANASCRSSGWSCWSESDSSSWECGFEDAGNDVVEDLEFSLFCLSPLSGEGYVGVATEMARVGNKVLNCQEEQWSPTSVLQVGEDEFSPFNQSLAKNEGRNQTFMQHIRKIESLQNLDPANLEQCISLEHSIGSNEEYDNDDNDNDNDNEDEEDWVEKRARELLHCVNPTGSVQSSKANLDKLLLDIFRDELNARRNQTRINGGDFGLDILRIAEDWIGGSFVYDIEHDNKDAYIKDMDWGERWGWLEEKQELVLEIETTILHNLVGELLGLDG